LTHSLIACPPSPKRLSQSPSPCQLTSFSTPPPALFFQKTDFHPHPSFPRGEKANFLACYPFSLCFFPVSTSCYGTHHTSRVVTWLPKPRLSGFLDFPPGFFPQRDRRPSFKISECFSSSFFFSNTDPLFFLFPKNWKRTGLLRVCLNPTFLLTYSLLKGLSVDPHSSPESFLVFVISLLFPLCTRWFLFLTDTHRSLLSFLLLEKTSFSVLNDLPLSFLSFFLTPKLFVHLVRETVLGFSPRISLN